MATARRLGINVLYVTDIERYIEKYMSKKKCLEKELNAENDITNDELSKNDSFNCSGYKKDDTVIKKSLEKHSNNKSDISFR